MRGGERGGHDGTAASYGGKRLRDFTAAELPSVCAGLRARIIETVGRSGGHLAPNLGVVELTVALHYVFDSPADAIVWDVGHQCYAHKLLTGRDAGFDGLRSSGGVAGFPRRAESPHDAFDTGHASTAISVALGLLAGEALDGGGARAVAVAGDGAMTGGMAYEGLSAAAQQRLPLIVVLNDNKMSINPNVGGLSRHLSRLSMRRQYQTFRRVFDSASKRIPLVGALFFGLVQRLKRAVKAVFYVDNFFVSLGFEYVGPIDGHNLPQLIGVFRDVRALRRPVVVHVLTQKGRGYAPAERDPGAFHSVPPFSPALGTLPAGGESWTRAFGAAMVELGRRDPRTLAVTAAMERGTGLSAFRAAFPGRFFDAGIAEAHAVTFAAALAARGFRPVVAIYSTFIQRAVDSVIHDTAIGALPVIFALDRAGFVSGDGETHQGLFDISLFRAVPGVTILAPACADELALMLDWAAAADGPCVIRYPKAEPPAPEAPPPPLERGRGHLVRARPGAAAPICLAYTGGLEREARAAQAALAGRGAACDRYNLRFLSAVDEDYLAALMAGYRVFAVMEEGARSGGVGEYVTRLASERGCAARIATFNAGDVFYAQATRDELLRRAGLDGAAVAARLAEAAATLK